MSWTKDLLKAEIRSLLEYDADLWITTAFNFRVSQYQKNYRIAHGQDPAQDLIDKFVDKAIQDNLEALGKELYEQSLDKIVDIILKSGLRHAEKRKFMIDRALAGSIAIVSVVSFIYVYERQEMTLLYGAVGIASLVSFIFAAKLIWNSIHFGD
ncbi:hypothetical protein AGMMS50276_28400 [Synergistales bacterium]|nr:hypothetical protein AGMMS50276_28400 [Synergistales bacterium]